eukprot:2081144-Prymnesium_polylepis.2
MLDLSPARRRDVQPPVLVHAQDGAPLPRLSSLFTLLLVWNMSLAGLWGEELNRTKDYGAL